MGVERDGGFSDFLTIYDIYAVDPAYMLSDRLTITDSFTYEHTTMFRDVLTVKNVFTYGLNSSRVLQDILELRNYFSASTNNPNVIQNPIDPVDNPGQNIQPTPGSPPGPGLGPFTMGSQRYVNQNVTFAAQAGTIVFKAPDFGDKQSDEPTIINEQTGNLALIQYRDKDLWKDFRLYELSWSQLDEVEISVIRIFLRRSCGQRITYTDIYGNSHVGVIPDPDQQATSANNGFSIKFTFLEGLLA